MSEVIQEIVLAIFGDNPILATVFIAMIPVVELRGAIPFGSSEKIWNDKALTVLEASVYSVVGSILSAVLIILFLIPVFKFLKKTKFFHGLVTSFEEKFQKKSDKITNDVKDDKNKFLKRFLGVMLFVAIPLPLTGVWTGSAVAVFLGLGFLKSFIAVSVGAIIAGGIVSGVTILLGDSALIVFYLFVVLLILFVLFYLVKCAFKRKINN